ncbi:hypothetical protein [Streptomyces sp. SID13031]|uniref:hypothetical protein n=1 Tax=Streptomyces sp. SID13031 TaxID=2706046 RepID=UPI0013CAD973|nr:hypothetical protein [Streptomyces sp. SID13031]NEA36001.1 hypothetical protein [Streptomyces sp. SID13031]
MQFELFVFQLLVLQHVQLLLDQHQHRVRRRLTAVRPPQWYGDVPSTPSARYDQFRPVAADQPRRKRKGRPL